MAKMGGARPEKEPEVVGGYCIAIGFFRRGFEDEARGDQVAKEVLEQYKGPVTDLWQTTTEPIGSDDGVKYYPRIRDSKDSLVYPAYDSDYKLVGLDFTAPNAQFPDKAGQVITDFEGNVLYSKLRDNNSENTLNQSSGLPQWMRDQIFR